MGLGFAIISGLQKAVRTIQASRVERLQAMTLPQVMAFFIGGPWCNLV
jgi:hypothetical protein